MSRTRLQSWVDGLRRHPTHLVLGLLLFVPWVWGLSIPLTGDQKVYLAIALEMRERGEWLTPYLFGEPAYFKPPFQYWMTRLGWEVFGFGLAGALLPSAVAALVSAWGLSEISRQVGGRQPFIQAGLWFLASIGTLTFGSTAQMEIWLCFFLILSWLYGLRFLSAPIGERNFGLLFVAFGLAGLAALNKSPLYSVFFVVSYFSYLLLMGEWELFIERRFWGALTFGMAVGASWFVLLMFRDGREFFDIYFMRETFAKHGGNGSSPWQIWSTLLYFCAPFTLLLLPSIRSAWTHRAKQFKFICLLISWSLWPALFFTFYPYRVTTYLYVLLPMAALLLDLGYLRSSRTKFFVWSLRITGVVVGGALLLGARVLSNVGLLPGALVWALVLLALAFAASAWIGWLRGVAGITILVLLCVRAAAVGLGERDLIGLKEFVEVRPQAKLAYFDPHKNIWSEAGLFSVRLKRPIARIHQTEGLITHLRAGGALVLADDQLDALESLKREFAASGAKLEFTEWNRLQRRLRFPYREVILGPLSKEALLEAMSRKFLIVEAK